MPLRLFIGVGWLRSFLDKVGNGAWWDGREITSFLNQQIADGQVVFPVYEGLINNLLRPGASWVGVLVMLIEFTIGLAILTGTYTNLALVIGAGLSVNFMLAGRITPAVFYLAIQTLLFVSGVGAVFGVDGKLSSRAGGPPGIALVARLPGRGPIKNDVSDVVVLAIVAFGLSTLGFVHASNFGPRGVEDPGVVLGVVCAMSALTLGIYAAGLAIRESWRRQGPGGRRATD